MESSKKAPNDNWWRGGVIYQIYPRSYADSNGDGIGDLPGITARLEHIARLGADGRLHRVGGVRYTAADGNWGSSLNLTAVAGKNSASAPNNVQPFLTPGFTLVDLTGYVNLTKNLRLAGGVFNIFDKKYWLWSNVGQTGLTTSSPGLDRYTQPGINVAVNLQLIY